MTIGTVKNTHHAASAVAQKLSSYFQECVQSLEDHMRDLIKAYEEGRKPGSLNLVTPAEFTRRKDDLDLRMMHFADLKAIAELAGTKLTISEATIRLLTKKNSFLHLFNTAMQVDQANKRAGVEFFPIADPILKGSHPVIVGDVSGIPASPEAYKIMAEASAKKADGIAELRKVSLGKCVTGGGLLDCAQGFDWVNEIDAISDKAKAHIAEACLGRWKRITDYFLQADDRGREIVSEHFSELVRANRQQYSEVDFDNQDLQEGVDYELIKP